MPHWYLKEYVSIAAGVLGQHRLQTPPVTRPPADPAWPHRYRVFGLGRPPLDLRLEYAKGLVRLVAARYGLALPRLAVRFASDLPEAGRIRASNGRWYIDLAQAYAYDDEQLLSIIAHEMAHVVLFQRGIVLEPLRRNEELTDAFAILAGFGPVMCRANYREQTQYLVVVIRTRTTTLGYLPIRDVKRLTRVRARLEKGKDVKRLATIHPDESRLLPCWACGAPLQVPFVRARVRLRCKICGCPEIIRLTPANCAGSSFLDKAGQRLRTWLDFKRGLGRL